MITFEYLIDPTQKYSQIIVEYGFTLSRLFQNESKIAQK